MRTSAPLSAQRVNLIQSIERSRDTNDELTIEQLYPTTACNSNRNAAPSFGRENTSIFVL
jgi:hypothetical protein